MAGDSMLDLYHRTTPEAARAILAENRFVTRENRSEAHLSPLYLRCIYRLCRALRWTAVHRS